MKCSVSTFFCKAACSTSRGVGEHENKKVKSSTKYIWLKIGLLTLPVPPSPTRTSLKVGTSAAAIFAIAMESEERYKQGLDKDQGSEKSISSNPRSKNNSDQVFYIDAGGDEVDYLCCQG